MQRNVFHIISKFKGKIPTRFNMYVDDAFVLKNNSSDRVDFMNNCFVFGYAQGYKAAKKELSKQWKQI